MNEVSFEFGLNCCHSKEWEETNRSLGLRVTGIVLGLIGVGGGLMILFDVPYISQLGTTVGLSSICGGSLVALMPLGIKEVQKRTTPLLQTPKIIDIPKPSKIITGSVAIHNPFASTYGWFSRKEHNISSMNGTPWEQMAKEEMMMECVLFNMSDAEHNETMYLPYSFFSDGEQIKKDGDVVSFYYSDRNMMGLVYSTYQYILTIQQKKLNEVLVKQPFEDVVKICKTNYHNPGKRATDFVATLDSDHFLQSLASQGFETPLFSFSKEKKVFCFSGCHMLKDVKLIQTESAFAIYMPNDSKKPYLLVIDYSDDMNYEQIQNARIVSENGFLKMVWE